MLFGINKPSFPSPPLPLLLVFCSHFALPRFLHFSHLAKRKWKWQLCRLRIGSFNTCFPSQQFNHVISSETGHAKPVFSLQIAGGLFHGMSLCFRLSVSGSLIVAENIKVKRTWKVGGAGKFPLILFFVFVLSQFSGPDYLGAWNRLWYFVYVYLTLLNVFSLFYATGLNSQWMAL